MSPAARFFQALGDETRLALLRELRTGDRTVGDLVRILGCPQPKVSRHLRVLREAGLVRPEKEGRNVRYAVTSPAVWAAEAREWIGLLDQGVPLAPASPRRPLRARTPPAPRSREPAPPSVRPKDLETYLL